MKINVLIADDHAVVRAGLRALIKANKELELVGEATGGYEALELIEKTKPDVLVLDLSMPDLDGISVTRILKEKGHTTCILILTVHEDEALLREAIKAGASGYIIKHAAEAELISAIQAVKRGDIYVHPKMIRSLLFDRPPANPKIDEATDPLTQRELDVLRLIVQGYTNKQVAEELSISVRTVEGHRSNLTEKLGLKSRVELVRYAREHHLID
ncbi:MAG: response regulator transcription factor [Anaerolineales bacterium]|nr:response regulator transcription factor [Anaerolineales bacterium]